MAKYKPTEPIVNLTPSPKGLNLIHGPGNRLSFLIRQFISDDHVIQECCNNMVLSYKKIDTTINQFPKIEIVSRKMRRHGLASYWIGTIEVTLSFPLNSVRVDLQRFANDFANYFELKLLDQTITKYCQDYTYGLWWVGNITEIDYKLEDNYPSVVIEFDYRVDCQAYVEQLRREGYDVDSPDNIKYPLAETYFYNPILE